MRWHFVFIVGFNFIGFREETASDCEKSICLLKNIFFLKVYFKMYFFIFDSVMKNKLENTFQYLIMLWKMSWKITY